MLKKILLALAALLVLVLLGGYLMLRSAVSDENVRPRLAAILSEALGQPVDIASAHLVFSPKIGIELTGVSIGDPARISVDSLRLATGLRPLLSKRIEGAEIVVDGGQVGLPLPPLGSQGAGDAPPAPSAPADSSGAGLTIVSVDTIALHNFRVTSGDRTLVVDLDTSLADDRLDVKKLVARAGDVTIEGTGAVTHLADPEASFDLTAHPLDLDALMAFLSAFAPAPEDGAPAAPAASSQAASAEAAASVPRITVRLTAPAGRVAGVDFTNLSATAKVANGIVTLDPLSFGVFQGAYKGRLTVDGTGPAPSFAWAAAIDGVDVASLLAFAGSAGAMTGTLSGTIDLEGSGTDAAEAIKALKGSGQIHVTDGTLPHLDLVGHVVRALGRPGEAPKGSGEAFTTLGGSFTLANGAMASPDVTFDSRDLDLKGKANVSLTQGTMDVRANLLLSEELTKRMGTDGQRLLARNGQMTMPAVVQGPFDAPKVTIDVGSVVKNAAAQELKKQLEKGIGNLLKKKKPGGGGR